MASIVQVNVSPGGVPKRAVTEAEITPVGLAGDGHAHPAIHGGPRKAVLLIAAETVEALAGRGFPIYFGALGENLTTRGLDYRDIRVGDQIRAGDAVLEITQPRGPCSTLDVYGPGIQSEIYDKQVKAGDHASRRWGMSGFYARVLVPGRVRADDTISVMAKSA